MILNSCLNSVINFFDSILPTIDLSSVMCYKDKFLELAGYGAYFFGSGFLKTVITLVMSFISLKLTVAVVQFIWEKIPTN